MAGNASAALSVGACELDHTLPQLLTRSVAPGFAKVGTLVVARFELSKALGAAPSVTLESRLGSDVQDAYFDYDKSDIRSDARDALTRDADALKTILRDFPNAVIVIEGHCDERGSAEYNLGLGDRRASSAKGGRSS